MAGDPRKHLSTGMCFFPFTNFRVKGVAVVCCSFEAVLCRCNRHVELPY